MKKHIIILFVVVFLPFNLVAQIETESSPESRNCSTMDVLDRLLREDPEYQKRLESLEFEILTFKKDGQPSETVIIIPVVIHVVYNLDKENISDAQINSQLTVLNDDFRALNSDISKVEKVFKPLVADCKIKFCLSIRDPNNASTNGITRTKTILNSFSTNDDVKKSNKGGKDPWPSDSYLNIWVCNLGGNLLGYAQFPGGPALSDGIVIGYKYFGTNGQVTNPRFNLGRTTTHEIGHWLSLKHIWGDEPACTGSDMVDDTPNQGDANFNCPIFPKVSCSNGPNGDLFMSYMDYSDDNCMYMYSKGQSTRMNAILNGSRKAILSSKGCTSP